MEMFWNYIKAVVVEYFVNVSIPTELFTLKGLILCYMNFTSIYYFLKKRIIQNFVFKVLLKYNTTFNNFQSFLNFVKSKRKYYI